jgi:cytochrome c oxidase subunit 2
VFYGQCSEICGLQHAFMPIAVEVTNLENYCEFIETILEETRADA